MGTLGTDDPQVMPLFVRAMEILLDELPVIPVTQSRKLVPFSTTYWKNWPTAENNYIQPPTWCQVNHVILQHITKA